MVLLDQKVHHADHLGRILLWAIEVGNLVAGQLKGRSHDYAASGLLPLWHDALLARRCECPAGLHLHGERAELVDREEGFVWAKLREDRMNASELLGVVWVGRCQHDARLAPA